MSIVDTIKVEISAFEEKRKAMVAELRTKFPDLLKPLFEQSKRIESIGWRQYTPYFNDGDECVFGVHNDVLDVNGISEYDDERGEENGPISFVLERAWNGKSWEANPNADPHEVGVLKQMNEVLTSIPDSFYKDLFGDHTRVTINRDGTIDVEEYEHD